MRAAKLKPAECLLKESLYQTEPGSCFPCSVSPQCVSKGSRFKVTLLNPVDPGDSTGEDVFSEVSEGFRNMSLNESE